MIERLQLIASFLARVRWLILVLGLGLAILFVLSLFQPESVGGDQLMLPAVAGFCWMVLLYSFSRLFITVPEKPGPEHGWIRRLGLKFRRGLMWLMGLAMIALGVAVLVLSYQLLRTYFMQ